MNTFLKNIGSNVVIHKVQELISELSRNEDVIEAIQCSFLPLLMNILDNSGNARYDSIEVKSVSLDILNALVKFSPRPINENFISLGFMNILRHMHKFEDINLLQVHIIFMCFFLI